MFSCFKKEKKVDEKVSYDSLKDSVYSLKKRIENEELEPDKFDLKYLEEKKDLLNECKTDINYRMMFFYKILNHIDYDREIKYINSDIEFFRVELSNKIKNTFLPTYFQLNKYLDTEYKLKKVILNEIHIDNIKILFDII